MSEKDEGKIVNVEFLESNTPKELSGTRVGDEYVRLSDEDAQKYSSIPAITEPDTETSGGTINIVWLIIKRSGKLLSEGQELCAQVRIGKRTGGFAIAGAVTLGVIVAIKVAKRSQDEH